MCSSRVFIFSCKIFIFNALDGNCNRVKRLFEQCDNVYMEAFRMKDEWNENVSKTLLSFTFTQIISAIKDSNFIILVMNEPIIKYKIFKIPN